MDYRFNFDEKEYILDNNNLDYFANDEVNEIKNIDENYILELMSKSQKVEFSKEYFNLPCDNCKEGVEEKQKAFAFLGFNFYLYTKDGEVVISNIQDEYEGHTFNRLLLSGKVDSSYIVSVIVCRNCGTYAIEIEEFEV